METLMLYLWNYVGPWDAVRSQNNNKGRLEARENVFG